MVTPMTTTGETTTIRVTTTPATVLRHAVELAERRDSEDMWEMQARILEELGYRIVGKDSQAQAVAAELRRIASWFPPGSDSETDKAQLAYEAGKYAVGSVLLRRADELDPQDGES